MTPHSLALMKRPTFGSAWAGLKAGLYEDPTQVMPRAG
jgi:hypothetical protein